MKLFGLELSRSSQDRITVKTVTPSTTPVSKIPTVKIGSLNYAQQFSRGRGLFVGSQYELSEIGKIEDTDGFVRQAFKKKEGLMFKEGVSVKGASKDTVRYYKTRMAQMAHASKIPETSLIKRIARSLIRTSNAFLVKVRDEKASGGRSRVTADGKKLKPVAAYFPAAPETMQVDLDERTGKIRKWKQVLPDGKYREYSPENVVHFVIDRREGFLFGTPTIIPVIDDIRALRQIEENIELLLYQHIFPLFHYKVGTETAPAGYTEEGVKEVEAVESQIRLMPSEGAIVTPERHEINAIGAEGRALRAEGYLTHFKKRVFAGLGVSSVDMGDGDTTNRATANTLSRALVDSVKAVQDELEAQWDHFIVSELLLESTFGDRVLEEDQMVHLKFAEIDIESKMDIEKHATELWKANGITHDEYRGLLGLEPLVIPDDPGDQDLSKYPEWARTYWKLIEEPMNLIRAVDEPYSAASQAAAQAAGSGITEQQLQKAQTQKEKEAKEATKTKEPQQPKVIKKDSYLSQAFTDLESDTAARLSNNVRSRGRIDKEDLMAMANVWSTQIADHMKSLTTSQFIKGFNDQTGGRASQAEVIVSVARSTIDRRIGYRIDKLAKDTINLVSKRIDEELDNVKLSEVYKDAVEQLHVAFDTLRYRTRFIWDMETKKAYTFGRVMGIRFLGDYGIELRAFSDTSCDKCKALNGRIVPANLATIDDVPPFHPNSRMSFEIVKEEI